MNFPMNFNRICKRSIVTKFNPLIATNHQQNFLCKTHLLPITTFSYTFQKRCSSHDAKDGKLVLFETEKVSDNSSIGIVTFNRPDKMNSLTEEMGKEFAHLFATRIAQEQEKDLTALVITGQGDRAFSAGGDFDFLLERCEDSAFQNSKRMVQFYNYFLRALLQVSQVPTISAINGHAIGAGLCVAMATDIRIVEKNAKVGVTFVGLGLSPGMGSTHFLPSLLGHQIASYLLLTGDVINGEKAKELQIALETLEGSSSVKQRALEIARKIALNPSSSSVRACLQSLRVQQLERLDARLMREADAQSQCYASAELKQKVTEMKNKEAKRSKQ